MKVAKLKKTEKKNKKVVIEEEEFSIKNLIKTIIIILLVLAVFYGITVLVVKPLVTEKKSEPVQFDPSKITMNQLLTRKDKKYYVLAVKESEYLNLYTDLNYFGLYNSYINDYRQKEDALNFYWINMDEAFNSAHWSDELNISKLIINDDVLFKISNGKIAEYYVGHDKIINALKKL